MSNEKFVLFESVYNKIVIIYKTLQKRPFNTKTSDVYYRMLYVRCYNFC